MPEAPYGSWKSPITTDLLTSSGISLSQIEVTSDGIYWLEGRPVESGRVVIVHDGVDVRVLVPGRYHDVPPVKGGQKASYERLLAGGVRIWEYQASMIHSKTMLIDDDLVIIGSVNLEPLSLNKLEEGALVAQDVDAATKLAKDFEEDCARSKEQK